MLVVIVLAVILSPNHSVAQNLFESDGGSGNIYEFTPNGMRSTFASGLVVPAGLAFDSAGNLFVADDGDFGSTSGIIYKFTTNAVRSTFVSGLNEPVALVFDKAGSLFEADFGSGKIFKFATNAVRSTFASGLGGPVGLAFDSTGNLFESDNFTNINEFTTNGVKSFFAPNLSSIYGLAVDRDGHVFGANNFDGRVSEFITNSIQIQVQNIFLFLFGDPTGLTFDGMGDLFVSDISANKIYELKNEVGFAPIVFASGLSAPTILAFQPGTPALNIAPAGNQSVLYWPAWAANFSLQTATNLSSTNWLTVTNGTPILGVTLTNTSPAAFFRLQSQ